MNYGVRVGFGWPERRSETVAEKALPGISSTHYYRGQNIQLRTIFIKKQIFGKLYLQEQPENNTLSRGGWPGGELWENDDG